MARRLTQHTIGLLNNDEMRTENDEMRTETIDANITVNNRKRIQQDGERLYANTKA